MPDKQHRRQNQQRLNFSFFLFSITKKKQRNKSASQALRMQTITQISSITMHDDGGLMEWRAQISTMIKENWT